MKDNDYFYPFAELKWVYSKDGSRIFPIIVNKEGSRVKNIYTNVIYSYDDFCSSAKEEGLQITSTLLMMLKYGDKFESENTSKADFMTDKIVSRTQLLDIAKTFSSNIFAEYKRKRFFNNFVDKSKDF